MKDWQYKVLQATKERWRRLLKEPPPPGMFRPFPNNPFVHGNKAAMEWFMRKQMGERPKTKWVVPHPDSNCIQARPDMEFPCHHPQQTPPIRWWVVTWLEPLSPFALPLRELQPAYLQKRYRKRFCCAKAAEMFAEHLRGRGCEAVEVIAPEPSASGCTGD